MVHFPLYAISVIFLDFNTKENNFSYDCCAKKRHGKYNFLFY